MPRPGPIWELWSLPREPWQRYTGEPAAAQLSTERVPALPSHPACARQERNFAAAETGFRDTALPVETFTGTLSKYNFKLRDGFFPLKSSLLSVL